MRTLKLCQKSEYLKLEKDRKHELEHSKDCDARLCWAEGRDTLLNVGTQAFLWGHTKYIGDPWSHLLAQMHDKHI